MNKKVDVLSIIINVIIVLFLVSFYGCGTMFIMSMMFDIGCISFGIGLVGTGIWLLLLKKPVEKEVGLVLPKQYDLSFPITYSFKSRGACDADLVVASNGCYIHGNQVEGGLIHIPFGAVKGWSDNSKSVSVVGIITDGVHEQDCDIVIAAKSMLKTKALIQYLKVNIRERQVNV